MNKTLTSTLEQLQSARVQVLSFSMRKQINLFDFESGPEISFNGFKSISAYQEKLDEWSGAYRDWETDRKSVV